MTIALPDFIAELTQNPALFITVLLTLGVILVNGWTDAPNAIATCVSTRSMGVRPAIIMAAVFNFLGVLVMTAINKSVAETIYGLVLSTFLGFAMGWLAVKLTGLICRRMNRKKTTGFFQGAQIASAGAMAFMHGAQDGQKFIGVFMLGLFLSKGESNVTSFVIPIWLMILCSAVMALGTSIGGYRIIKSVGMDMVSLEKYQGFAADLAGAGCLLISSVSGLPVSTTHTKTTAIMGVGASKGRSFVNWGVGKDMVLTWVLTFPACGLLGSLRAGRFLCIVKAVRQAAAGSWHDRRAEPPPGFPQSCTADQTLVSCGVLFQSP